MATAGLDETRLRRAFLEEAEELSQKLGDSLLALETDASNAQLINEVFRLTHSLKSESALMGFARLSALAHRMEDVLGLARGGTLLLSKPVLDAVFAGADVIAEMMAAIAKGGSDSQFDTTGVLGILAASGAGPSKPAAAREGSAPGTDSAGHQPPQTAAGAGAPPPLSAFQAKQLAEARDRGENLYKLTVVVDPDEPMRFPRAYLVFSNLEAMANVIQVYPPMDGDTADDSLYGRTILLLTAQVDEGTIRTAASVDQVAEVIVEQPGFADYLVQVGQPGTGPESTPLPVEAGAPAAAREEPGRRVNAVEKTSIRVDTRKLDDLWSLIAELVLHKSHIARLTDDISRGADVHTVREELVESFDSLDKISEGMQQTMMDTRMIPISVIFSKFPRLVRDLSRKIGKPIDLVLSGEDTEIDRGIVEALSDPLTHIIRNSLDHGIEFPEERVRCGKPEKGRVSVAARRQGGNIVIELADDGRGMDAEVIRRKAMAMGIPGAGSFSESQLLELVFLPGFSTKEVVTDLSGRGVGMDVVATRVRGDLKGDVMLGTEPGKGTRVTLLLPLTLTIVNALLVRGDTQIYAIPLTDLDSTAKLLSTEIGGEEGRESSQWAGEEIPVYSLAALFGGGRRRAEEHFAAVLRHGERRAFLIVDELIEEREVVIKPVDDLLNTDRMFSGVSVLEDGRLVFILDTSFVRREHF
jgi:two-component system, chemotaxis family, sensor kinase CheA